MGQITGRDLKPRGDRQAREYPATFATGYGPLDLTLHHFKSSGLFTGKSLIEHEGLARCSCRFDRVLFFISTGVLGYSDIERIGRALLNPLSKGANRSSECRSPDLGKACPSVPISSAGRALESGCTSCTVDEPASRTPGTAHVCG